MQISCFRGGFVNKIYVAQLVSLCGLKKNMVTLEKSNNLHNVNLTGKSVEKRLLPELILSILSSSATDLLRPISKDSACNTVSY